MSIADKIESMYQHVEEAYSRLEEAGATMPERKNIENLPSVISSVPSGGGEEIIGGTGKYYKAKPGVGTIEPDTLVEIVRAWSKSKQDMNETVTSGLNQSSPVCDIAPISKDSNGHERVVVVHQEYSTVTTFIATITDTEIKIGEGQTITAKALTTQSYGGVQISVASTKNSRYALLGFFEAENAIDFVNLDCSGDTPVVGTFAKAITSRGTTGHYLSIAALSESTFFAVSGANSELQANYCSIPNGSGTQTVVSPSTVVRYADYSTGVPSNIIPIDSNHAFFTYKSNTSRTSAVICTISGANAITVGTAVVIAEHAGNEGFKCTQLLSNKIAIMSSNNLDFLTCTLASNNTITVSPITKLYSDVNDRYRGPIVATDSTSFVALIGTNPNGLLSTVGVGVSGDTFTELGYSVVSSFQNLVNTFAPTAFTLPSGKIIMALITGPGDYSQTRLYVLEAIGGGEYVMPAVNRVDGVTAETVTESTPGKVWVLS